MCRLFRIIGELALAVDLLVGKLDAVATEEGPAVRLPAAAAFEPEAVLPTQVLGDEERCSELEPPAHHRAANNNMRIGSTTVFLGFLALAVQAQGAVPAA
jgi:hypothetical protein